MTDIWHDSSDKWFDFSFKKRPKFHSPLFFLINKRDNVVGSMLKDLDDQNFELRIGALKMLSFLPIGKIIVKQKT